MTHKQKLEEYLTVLDDEDADNHLTYGDADKLISHIELENNIVKELEGFRKIITPLEIVYVNTSHDGDENILKLKSSIDGLAKKVVTRTNENREKLETILVSIDTDLTGIAKKKLSRAIYGTVDSKMLDVTG